MAPKFNYVVCSIEESKYIDLLSLDELQTFLLVHEQKIIQQDKEEKRQRQRRGRGGYRSTIEHSKSVDKSNVECYRCHKHRHYQNECRTNLPKDSGEKSNFAETEEEITLLMVCNTKEDTNKQLWYMDTCCNNHMCGDKEIFSNLDEPYRDNVKFVNSTKISVMGKGRTLQQKKMVVGLPILSTPTEICERCIVSKQHRDPFLKGKTQRARELPINPTSNGGKRYIITFIDDLSRKTWAYFLQEKSEALTTFKAFKAIVEKEVECPIQVLRTDRGGEYNSHEFTDFCNTHEIKRQLTATYTPQQNGVCERKNRTIMNMVRSLLAMSRVPKSFWPEAVNWSLHILNKIAVRNMTPEEAWNGRQPAVDHFRIFGCIAYAHVPDVKRKKLDDKGEKCIFVSVSDNSKAYKLYNPHNKP
ncbi:Retrovirus-related Pol polyprotein from transposon TNT 1-94 [Gossypium australe]|uniref:Retrovirus-related Pol polyprotein from transposon TNT 1-94 n=1 Tax=Gossypium australe TaxID=47621 RepID=A0A5B6WCI4_9ROSI|nr:Retrovirus-related Pol polyprotein from transposon TNT 1-94 [Gossypium australe]